jgi:E3 ubiquitin-protein ligase DMA1/2
VADLEAEVEDVESEWEDGLEEAIEASKSETKQNGHGNESTDADGDSEMIDTHTPGPSTTAEPITNGHVRGERQSTPNEHHDTPARRRGSSQSAIPASVISTTAITPPRAIPGRHESPSTRIDLAPGQVVADGPMTPRNDAGPFVLDGGAGRSRDDAVSLNHPSADEEEA